MNTNNNILPADYQDDMLEASRLGKLKGGLKIDCDLDNHLLFKYGQFNLFLGHDNVGKTFFMLWYMTMLSIKHELTWTMYCSENKPYSIKSKIISFFLNENYKNVDEGDYIKAKSWMERHFSFINTNVNLTAQELITIFENDNSDGYLIDPYNSISKGGNGGHDYEYEVASLFRRFCEKKQKTIYINMHPVTEASRMKHKDGKFKGQQMPPTKGHAEGGTKWPSRCDDFIILHRYWTPEFEKTTMVFVEKIKETETGGKRTMFEDPLMFDYSEYGFSVNGKNPLTENLHIPNRMFGIKSDAGMKNFMFDEESGDIEDEPPF